MSWTRSGACAFGPKERSLLDAPDYSTRPAGSAIRAAIPRLELTGLPVDMTSYMWCDGAERGRVAVQTTLSSSHGPLGRLCWQQVHRSKEHITQAGWVGDEVGRASSSRPSSAADYGIGAIVAANVADSA